MLIQVQNSEQKVKVKRNLSSEKNKIPGSQMELFNSFRLNSSPYFLLILLTFFLTSSNCSSEFSQGKTTFVGSFLPESSSEKNYIDSKNDGELEYIKKLQNITPNSTPFDSVIGPNGQFVREKTQNTSLILEEKDLEADKNETLRNLNLNLVRNLQLWSSTLSSSKINLTQEHEILLRIEPETNLAKNSTKITTDDEKSLNFTFTTTTESPKIKTMPLNLPKNNFYETKRDEKGENNANDVKKSTFSQNLDKNEELSEEDFPEVENFHKKRQKNVEKVKSLDQNGIFLKNELDESGGLADVISRGRIDSVMYVYFGGKFNDYHKEEIAGRIIQAVGGVVSAIAHVLTVLGAAKCIKKRNNGPDILPIQLHIGFALLISNLLLILAVHAVEPADVCASVAILLHYLHLVVGVWLLAHSVQTYRALCHHINAPNSDPGADLLPYGQRAKIAASTLRYCLLTWAAPFPFILLSYLVSPEGYETNRYCWMSIEKGMVVSFIVPVFILIGCNTMMVILSLRHLLALKKLWEDPILNSESGEECVLDEKNASSGIRASAMLLPLLAISWFLSVVALENPTSVFFSITSALSSISLSWLVLYFLTDEDWSSILCPHLTKQNPNRFSSSIEECSSSFCSSIHPSAACQLPFDSQPLLSSPQKNHSSAHHLNSNNLISSNSLQNESGAGPSCAILPQKNSSPGPSKFINKLGKKRPNWARPGGNEIYELKHDAISTIYK